MSKELSAIDTASRSNLPSEVWSQIFAYLPADDRKNIRLTCRSFYESCNCTSILSKEEIVFSRGNCNTTQAILSLSDSCRKVWNIKLESAHLADDTILLFFEKQGAKVRSLIFHECKFAPGLLKSIIEFSVNLRNISLTFSYFLEPYYADIVLNDFKVLVDRSIVCNEVSDFTLKIPFIKKFSNRKFLWFFVVFPNIKRLDLELEVGQSFSQFSTISADITTDEVFSFSCLYDRISTLSSGLEKLRLKFENRPDYYSYLWMPLITKIRNIEMKNLKELSLYCVNLKPDISIMHPFLEFNSLTHFDCDIRSGFCSHATVSTFLQLLLNNVTTLRSLTLRVYSFCMDCELFKALVKSKLVSLDIRIDLEYDHSEVLSTNFESSALENTLLPNFNLKYLNVEQEQQNLMFLFCTYFRNLELLSFGEVNGLILQNIFQYQTKIRKLFLYNCRRWPYRKCIFRKLGTYQKWLAKEGAAIKRELEYLIHLNIHEDKYCLTQFMLSEFRFPKLKFLSIYIQYNSEFNYELFKSNMCKFPELKYLKLVLPISLSSTQLLAVFKGLPKLRHFYLEDTNINQFNDSEYRQLFSGISSLRTVEHRLKSLLGNCAKYYYDITTKTVVDISESSGTSYYLEFRSPLI